MLDFDKTTYYAQTAEEMTSPLVTIFDGGKTPRIVKLNEYGKNFIYFGL